VIGSLPDVRDRRPGAAANPLAHLREITSSTEGYADRKNPGSHRDARCSVRRPNASLSPPTVFRLPHNPFADASLVPRECLAGPPRNAPQRPRDRLLSQPPWRPRAPRGRLAGAPGRPSSASRTTSRCPLGPHDRLLSRLPGVSRVPRRCLRTDSRCPTGASLAPLPWCLPGASCPRGAELGSAFGGFQSSPGCLLSMARVATSFARCGSYRRDGIGLRHMRLLTGHGHGADPRKVRPHFRRGGATGSPRRPGSPRAVAWTGPALHGPTPFVCPDSPPGASP
jgi:hypothetical protein